MRRDGALATVVHIHWGNEYRPRPTSTEGHAQKLCDRGWMSSSAAILTRCSPWKLSPPPTAGAPSAFTPWATPCPTSGFTAPASKPATLRTACCFSVTFRRTGDDPVQISGRGCAAHLGQSLPGRRSRRVPNRPPLDTAQGAPRLRFDRPAAGPADTGNDGPANAENSYERTGPGADGLRPSRVCFPGGRLRQDTRRDTFVGYTVVGGDGYD